MRTQTAGLHDPNLRTRLLPLLKAALADILRGAPPPAPPLREAIYKLQRDLSRLAKSQRYEFALASQIDDTLSLAERLTGCPPRSGAEAPPERPPAREFSVGGREFFIVPSRDGWRITGPDDEILDTLPTKVAALRAAIAMIRGERHASEQAGGGDGALYASKAVSKH